MKNLSFVCIALALSINACKKSDADKAGNTAPMAKGAPATEPVSASPPPAAAKLVSIDLSAGGDDWKGLTIMVPEGAALKPGSMINDVTNGGNFQLELYTGKTDLAARKKEITANDINKFKAFTTDSADALVFESAVMDPEVHFVANVKVGAKEFFCEDKKGKIHSAADIAAMYKACQSIAAAK
jgi:hypothetical protein